MAFTLWLGAFEIAWAPKQFHVFCLVVFKIIVTNFTCVEQCAKLVNKKSEHFFHLFKFHEE